MLSVLVRVVSVGAIVAGAGAGLAGPAGAADFSCAPGSSPAWNRTAEVAPVYEDPGGGEVFTSIRPNAQLCTDYHRANGPGGTYLHLTADGSGGQSDGWVHERFATS